MASNKATTVDRLEEDLGQADFNLPEAQPMPIAQCQRRRQTIEERLNLVPHAS
jgi:hypothetical protein